MWRTTLIVYRSALLSAVFYIDQSGIILGKVGTGRDISRPINYMSELVWIYPNRPTLSLNRLNLYRPTNP